jgi:hypothetical protein
MNLLSNPQYVNEIYTLTRFPYSHIQKHLMLLAERFMSKESNLSIFVIFSIEINCAWGGIWTSDLLKEPCRAQSDALAISQ